jgi:xanthine dehydrogenase YagR molybdenum-binding subunit
MNDFFSDKPSAPFLDRVDGRAKVTGTAAYSGDYSFPNLCYGTLVGSTIAKGSVASINTKDAERAPGVLAVITHQNLPPVPGYQDKPGEKPFTGYRVFGDDKIRFSGQPIALVVADTFERAVQAATLVKVQYKKEPHHTNLEEAEKEVKPLEGEQFKDYVRNDKDAWKQSAVHLEAEYRIPIEVHNPMEPHAITVVWEGADKVTVYEKAQSLQSTQQTVMQLFDLKEEAVQVITKFIGGAFGSAFNTWPHAVAALIGARKVGRPLKLVLNRLQMFTHVGYRPESVQKIGIGAGKNGKLVGISHEATAMTASYAVFTEGIVEASRSLYSCPNVFTAYKVYPLDLSVPTWMRGPGETTGSFALESAMDELAAALQLDPLELRLINYAEKDEEKGKPYSSKYLKEAYQLGAEKFGWKDRSPNPRSMKEGEWLVGYGVANGIFSAWRGESKIGATLLADGTLILRTGVTDMGPGTATAMTKLASERLGIPAEKIKFELGDSRYPPGIFQGGSGTTSTLGTTVHQMGESMKSRLVGLLKTQESVITVNDVQFANGEMRLKNGQTISYTDAMKVANLPSIEFVESSGGNPEMQKYAAYSYAVHFVKVLVHPLTGRIKVARVVTSVDAGKIVNEKTAESQMIGAVVGGIGMSLMEEGVIDHRYGRWVNNNFADYHVPVNADVPKVEVVFVNKPDPVLNPAGAKGIGEVGLVGFAAAVANAVYHATGKRIRELPITPEKVLL